MAKFFDEMNRVLKNDFNYSTTENGASGFRTTNSALLDINFALSSFRSSPAESVILNFSKAYFEDKLNAIKWLFFVGDVRGGAGERRFFRLCTIYLANVDPDIMRALLPLIPEYTRWDNILCLLLTDLCDDVLALIKTQLEKDVALMKQGKPISLCAKWMPSENATASQTQAFAKIIIEKMGITAKEYRKTLSALRKYLKLVEVNASAKKWGAIDYEAVPSKANLLYSDAFLLHDKTRRERYLESLKKGTAKINAGTLFPYEIVTRYTKGSRGIASSANETLEQLWNALPDYVKGDESTICVADGSGSMLDVIKGTSTSLLDVANSLAIYFAERAKGDFKNKYITFSENPQLVNFSRCKTLRDKIGVALGHSEVANTNIEAVFDLILKTAVKGRLKQSEIPNTILIISDMEFDSCTVTNANEGMSYFDIYTVNRQNPVSKDKRLFETIAERYNAHGYKLPRLVFWNICSRTRTIPVIENELGLVLVSGFTPAMYDMVLSGETDPLKALLRQLNKPRYDAVEIAVKPFIN